MKPNHAPLVSITTASLVAWLVLLTPVSAETLLTINLPKVATVTGSRFVLGDIATFHSGSTALWNLAAAEPIGATPLKGMVLTLTANGLLGLLAQRGYDWRKIEVVGAQVSTISRSEQTIPAQTILDYLAVRLEEELGTKVVLEPIRPMPAIELPGGNAELRLRFPGKPGKHLPDAVEFHLGGRLATTLPLALYLRFTLNAVVAATPVAARTELMPQHLSRAELTLSAGSEVVTDAAEVLGQTTRTAVPKGNAIRMSRLKVPADILRGSEITLVIVMDGVTLKATAIALSDGFIGQRITVKRLHDKKKYTGRVIDGPLVVVE